MALVPGSLQIDIFITNIPGDPMTMSPAGTNPKEKKPDPPSGSKLQIPGKHYTALHTSRISQSLTDMEDVPLDFCPPVPIYLVQPEEKSRWNRSRVSISDDYNTLLVPSPIGFADGRYGSGGLKGKDYEYEMGVRSGGHFQEDSTYDILDYTHFNGDLDAEVAPAEELLSRRLRQEGAARRRKTRKAMGYHSQNSPWVDFGQQVGSPTSAMGPEEYPRFSPPSSLHSHESAREDRHSRALTLDVTEATLTGKQARRVSVPVYLQQYEFGQRDPSKPRDKSLDRASIRDSIVDVSAVQSLMPKTGKGARGEEMEIEFSGEELEDVLVMAEYAWPGRPRLDKLLREEVEKARGAIVVACERFPSSRSLFARDSDSELSPVRFS